MDAIKLAALRDFAIDHLPRTQRVREQKHATHDGYHVALYGSAVLTLGSASASAVERAAASLLQDAMGLMINWDTESTPTLPQRRILEQQLALAAADLSALTGTFLPWLEAPMSSDLPPAPELPPTQPDLAPLQPPAATRRAAPPPDIYLSTEEAAEYLNVKPQTLHKWSSQDSGPLKPVRQRTGKLGWPSNEVLRVMSGK